MLRLRETPFACFCAAFAAEPWMPSFALPPYHVLHEAGEDAAAKECRGMPGRGLRVCGMQLPHSLRINRGKGEIA